MGEQARARALLKRNAKISDYRLLAVPLAEEAGAPARFTGCELGVGPRVFALAEQGRADGILSLLEDPEVGSEHDDRDRELSVVDDAQRVELLAAREDRPPGRHGHPGRALRSAWSSSHSCVRAVRQQLRAGRPH